MATNETDKTKENTPYGWNDRIWEAVFRILSSAAVIIILLIGLWITRVHIHIGTQPLATPKPWFQIEPALAKKLSSNNVHVETESGSGSGCWVRKDLVITARHVVVDEILDRSLIQVSEEAASVVSFSKTGEDKAFLKPKTPNSKLEQPWPLYFGQLTVGQPVIIVGDPQQLADIVQPATIASTPESGQHTVNVLASFLAGGISGGCAYTTNGELFGIVTLRQGESLGTIQRVQAIP